MSGRRRRGRGRWIGGFRRLMPLFVGEDGLLYGTALGRWGDPFCLFLILFRGRSTMRFPLPDGRPLDLGLQTGPDGKIYGFTTASFYEFDPAPPRYYAPCTRKKDAFQIPGPVMGNSVYFLLRKHEMKRLVI